MAQSKCPLCGDKIVDGVCASCGFSLPDEEVIAAPYNYDPSDYNIEEEKQRAAVLEKEMYAMPEIKVAGDGKPQMDDAYSGRGYINGSGAANVRDGQYGSLQGNPAQGNYPAGNAGPYVNNNPPARNVNPYANANPAAGNGNPYANVNPAAGNPYANRQANAPSPYANNNPPAYNPRANTNNGNPYANFNPNTNNPRFGKTGSAGNTAELVIAIILALFHPIFGIVFISDFAKKSARTRDPARIKALVILIIVTVLRMLIGLA